MNGGWRPWLSAMATNTAIARIAFTLIRLIGLGPFLLVHLPTTCSRRRWAFGCFTSSTSSRRRTGRATANGTRTRRPCVAARTTISPCSALAYRQYRNASHSSSVLLHSVLSAAAGATRMSGASPGGQAHAAGKLRLCAARALGRRAADARVVPRGPCIQVTRPPDWREVSRHRRPIVHGSAWDRLRSSIFREKPAAARKGVYARSIRGPDVLFNR